MQLRLLGSLKVPTRGLEMLRVQVCNCLRYSRPRAIPGSYSRLQRIQWKKQEDSTILCPLALIVCADPQPYSRLQPIALLEDSIAPPKHAKGQNTTVSRLCLLMFSRTFPYWQAPTNIHKQQSDGYDSQICGPNAPEHRMPVVWYPSRKSRGIYATSEKEHCLQFDS